MTIFKARELECHLTPGGVGRDCLVLVKTAEKCQSDMQDYLSKFS